MKFSFIVAIYNIEKYLDKCINSLINQTYRDFEILLIDDGSTDSCSEICKKYVEKDKRVRYFRKENGGQASARNLGIENATGDYIWFVDGDDYISEEALEKLQNELSKKQYDILCFNACKDRNSKITPAEMYNSLIENDKKYMLSVPAPWSKIYKTSLIKENNIFFKEGIIYEDLAMVPTVVIYTTNIGFLENNFYYYVIREGSTMNARKFKPNRDDKFVALETLEEYFKKNNAYGQYKDEIEYLYIQHLLVMYSSEILIYSKDIYKDRLIKAVSWINEKFPEWKNNKYLMNEGISKRVYVNLLDRKMFKACKFMNAVHKMLMNKIDGRKKHV